MSDYGTMTSRILDELKRPSLTAAVQDAIQQAIEEYKSTRFYFNEHSAKTTTSAGVEKYTMPTDFLEPDRLTFTVSDDEYPLMYRTWEWMSDRRRDASTFQGLPTDWAYYRDQIYLWPAPNNAYVMSLYYLRELTTLSVSADTNAWMSEGERLIRSAAKRILAEDVLHDDRQAQRYAIRERLTLNGLLGQSANKRATGLVRTWGW